MSYLGSVDVFLVAVHAAPAMVHVGIKGDIGYVLNCSKAHDGKPFLARLVAFKRCVEQSGDYARVQETTSRNCWILTLPNQEMNWSSETCSRDYA